MFKKVVKFHGSHGMDVEVVDDYGIYFIHRKFLGIFGKEERYCLMLSDLNLVTYEYPAWYKDGTIIIGSKSGDTFRIDFPKRRLQEAKDFCLYVNRFKGGFRSFEDDDLTIKVRVNLDET